MCCIHNLILISLIIVVVANTIVIEIQIRDSNVQA